MMMERIRTSVAVAFAGEAMRARVAIVTHVFVTYVAS